MWSDVVFGRRRLSRARAAPSSAPRPLTSSTVTASPGATTSVGPGVDRS
jgi:hypothetical protein